MSYPAVTFDQVAAARGRRVIWSDASWDLSTGSFTAVIGANGSGKTTLAQVVLGLIRPIAGDVRVFGAPAMRGNPAIGLVPQRRSLANARTVRCRDLVATSARRGRRRPRVGRAERAAEIDAAMDATGARAWADERLGELSGGEQQRVSIAAAMVGDPALLILDEPLAGLDLAGQVDLVELVHRISHDQKVTVMFVTHDLNPVLDHIDSAIYVVDGTVRRADVDEITDPSLLSRIYGTPVRVSRTADGCVFTRAE